MHSTLYTNIVFSSGTRRPIQGEGRQNITAISRIPRKLYIPPNNAIFPISLTHTALGGHVRI